VARVLAVDVGTSSLRAELFDGEGTPLREIVRRRYEPGPTLDPEPLVASVRDAITAAGPIDAVAYSCLWHSLVALDERDRPVTPVFTWLDRSAAEDAIALARELDPVAAHARTGAPIHPSFWPAQLRRLRREGVSFARVAAFPDYLRARLHGGLATTTSIASGTGLYRVHELRWDEELVDVLGIDESHVPPVHDDVVMLGDGAAANVGAGCVTAERACISIGTSGALRVVRSDAESRPGLFLYRLDRDRYVQGGALSDGGNLLVWLSRHLSTTIGDALDRPPGRVAFLPQLGGERSLGWRPDATGAISGLTMTTTSEDVVQAAFEGISYHFRDILDTLAWPSQPSELGQANRLSRSESDIRQVVATGTALLARPGWGQLLADVLEVPVTFSAVAEASARGAALVAIGRTNLPAPLGETFEPRPERFEAHRDARERLRQLYEATTAPTS
jgi:gluconokinase